MTHLLLVRLLYPALIAAGVLLALRWLIRRDAPLWLFIVSIVVPPVVLIRSFAGQRIQSWHGLMHDSIIYRIYESGVPPENPLMALEPLRYAYLEHYLIAALMRLIPLAPSQWFAIIDVLLIVVLACLIDRVAARLSDDKALRYFSVLMALLGTSPMTWGAFLKVGTRLALEPEPRLNPIGKFLTPQNNQVGFVCSALVLLGLAHLFHRSGKPLRGYVMVFAGLVAGGFLYPMCWLACVAMVGAIAIHFVVFLPAAGARRRGAILLALLVVSVAVVAPYLWSLTAGKAGKSELVLVSELPVFLRGLKNVVALSIVPAVVFFAARRSLAAEFRAQPALFTMLAIWSVVGYGLFLAVRTPMYTQYKFVATAFLGLGVLLGAGLAILDKHPRLWPLALAVPFPMVFSVAMAIHDQIVKFPIAEPLFERGIALEQRDPDQAALDRWIIESAPRDAVLMDDKLILTSTTRRTMYLGYVNEQKKAAGIPAYADHDGWDLPPWLFLKEVAGVDDGEYQRRECLVKALFLGGDGDAAIDVEGLTAAARSLRGRPLYIVARDPALAGRLRSLPHLVEAFSNPAATVFRVEPSKE